MQTQIEIISVSAPQTVPTKGGKSYQILEVAYKRDGKVEGKKLVSFTYPHVFKAMQSLKQGDVVYISLEKGEPNAAGQSYWQWTGISHEEGAPQHHSTSTATPSQAASGGGQTKTPSGGNWETKEERAARQVMIVRQSSLANAVALADAQGDKKATADSIIATAKQFEAYVLDTEVAKPAATNSVPGFEDMQDDIPF